MGSNSVLAGAAAARKFTIGSCALLAAAVVWAAAAHGATPGRGLLRDGSFLLRVDGRLMTSDSSGEGGYLFVIDSNITDGLTVVTAGTRLGLLPSAALERMVDDFAARGETQYRISATVTRYGKENFLFVRAAFSLVKDIIPAKIKVEEVNQPDVKAIEPPTVKPVKIEGVNEPNAGGSEAESLKEGSGVNAPNDVLAVPNEVLEKLAKHKIFRPVAPVVKVKPVESGVKDMNQPKDVNVVWVEEQPLIPKQNSLLTGRVGLIRGLAQSRWQVGWDLRFEPDSFGRSLEPGEYELLPCEALETALGVRAAEADRVRFRAAGFVTEYMGKKYLLLQRATRVYSYQNFGR